MAHPMCGGNLRRGTKIVAFGDAVSDQFISFYLRNAEMEYVRI